MVIPNRSALATAIRRLKNQGCTDKEIAHMLDIPVNRVHYIRSQYGIGGRYALYNHAMHLISRDEPLPESA